MLRCLAAVLPHTGRVGPIRSLSSVTPHSNSSLPIQPPSNVPNAQPSLVSLRKILAAQDSSTANRVKSYYTSLSTRSQLSQLTHHDMSRIITLFGSLSSPSVTHPRRFLGQQTWNVKLQPGRDYWGFVLQVAKDKCRLGQPLTHGDCYWLMQAHLARSNLNAASIYYKRIALFSASQDVHVSYLTALLEGGAVDPYVDTVSFLISNHKHLPKGLFFTFASLITSHNPTDTHKTHIANALSTRFRHHAHETSPPFSSQGRDAQDLMNHLETAFRRPLKGGGWEMNLLASLFSPSRTVHDRWDHFLLFVLAVTASHSSAGFAVHNPRDNDTQTVIWRTILLLSTSQGLAGISPPSALPQLQRIVRAVWRPFEALPAHVCDAVARRLLIATFLRLASGMRDGVLVEACGQYCLQEIARSNTGDDVNVMLEPLLAELCVASMICTRHEWKRILLAASGVYSVSKIASLALCQLSRLDVDAALRLHGFCLKWKIDLLSDAAYASAHQLASAGRTEEALTFLSMPIYTPHQREILISILFHPSVSQKLRLTEPHVVHALLPAVRSIAQDGPTQSFAPHLQYLLLRLAAGSDAVSSFAIFLTVFKKSSSYFQPSFLAKYLNTLLFHRQFKLATRLVAKLNSSLGAPISLRAVLLRGLIRSDSYALVRHQRRHTRGRQYSSPIFQLCRKSSIGAVRSNPLQSLPIAPFILRHGTDVKTVQLGLMMLVKAQRLSAARRVFSSLAPSLDDKTKTLYGNIVLHGTALRSRSVRGRRALRRVLHMLETLKRDFGFLEDGVTKNIILGATLRWRDGLTDNQLRALYDFQVHIKQGRTSFFKHIRPMYKLFIKAFHLRGDHHGANTAIQRLKAEQEQFEREVERRTLARMKGRQKTMKRD